MAIIDDGGYRPASGREVPLGDSVAAAVAGTRLYLPGQHLPGQRVPGPVHGRDSGPFIEVTNETCLAAAQRHGGEAACLVFASAKNPGGGFLNGAQAQEESIARVSALYTCLTCPAAREF